VRLLDVDRDSKVHSSRLGECSCHCVSYQRNDLIRVGNRKRHIASRSTKDFCLIDVLKVTISKVRGLFEPSETDQRHTILHGLDYAGC
jgi:hypothetical protein